MEPNSPGIESRPEAPQAAPAEAFVLPPVEEAPAAAPTPEKKKGAAESVNQNAGPIQQMAPVAPPPQPAAPAASATPVQAPSTDIPAAKDGDTIEQVWVDKAKQIVAQTRDNPHEQERQINLLQEDYQRKRFGRERRAPAA